MIITIEGLIRPFVEKIDLYQLFNLAIAGITNILALYLVVTMGYWVHRLRFSQTTLRPFFFGVCLAKAAVWFWTFLNILNIVIYNETLPLFTLPARLFFLVACSVQAWNTTRIKPAPRLSTVDLERELNLGGRMILIVEDNEPLARIYRNTLERVGLNAEFVTSGEDALVFIGQEKPGLVIVDLNLPDTDGVTLTLRLREVGYVGPVVAISGAANLVDEEKLAPAKFNQVLSKPIRAGDLVGVVNRWARSGS